MFVVNEDQRYKFKLKKTLINYVENCSEKVMMMKTRKRYIKFKFIEKMKNVF